MPKCAKDIVTGLQHLHHMHIQGQKKQVKVGSGGGSSGFQGHLFIKKGTFKQIYLR